MTDGAATRARGPVVGAIVALRRLGEAWRGPLMVLWGLGLVVLAFLYWAPSMTPPTSVAGVELGLDKLFHAAAHAGFVCLPLAILADGPLRRGTVALALLVAVGFELGQLWAPGRSFGASDLAANAL
ncbi:MAG: hypothetical protein JNL07_07110, partial [Rhodospirillales bacterium]|nr:hypothetical protein [Rhodospirillales bacterium]